MAGGRSPVRRLPPYAGLIATAAVRGGPDDPRLRHPDCHGTDRDPREPARPASLHHAGHGRSRARGPLSSAGIRPRPERPLAETPERKEPAKGLCAGCDLDRQAGRRGCGIGGLRSLSERMEASGLDVAETALEAGGAVEAGAAREFPSRARPPGSRSRRAAPCRSSRRSRPLPRERCALRACGGSAPCVGQGRGRCRGRSRRCRANRASDATRREAWSR
jgi:hypothetical protein